MITLHEFLNVMDLDSNLIIYDNDTFDRLAEGCRDVLDLPYILYDAKVIHFTPGIVTKIFVEVID